MIKAEIAYICDCCGRKVSTPFDGEELEVINLKYYVEKVPEGWNNISPFGLCCDKCVCEFMGVYERIHAPIKAREIRR